jgi:hypothetical protein
LLAAEAPAAEGGLDAEGLLVVADGAEELALGDRGVPAVGFRRRFGSEQPMRLAIEAGTLSPWTSRLLEGCGHEVLVYRTPRDEAHLRRSAQDRQDRC